MGLQPNIARRRNFAIKQCNRCGNSFAPSNFAMTKSIFYPDGSLPICNDCIELYLVDVDFDEYRRKHEMRTVSKNVSIPSCLNEEAESANINFSALLQKAIKSELHLSQNIFSAYRVTIKRAHKLKLLTSKKKPAVFYALITVASFSSPCFYMYL